MLMLNDQKGYRQLWCASRKTGGRPSSPVDRAFLVTVLPEIPDQARALAELHRVIKPDGVLSVTEEFCDSHYPFAFETIQRVEAAGFRLEQRFGNWWIYTLNFTTGA